MGFKDEIVGDEEWKIISSTIQRFVGYISEFHEFFLIIPQESSGD